MTDSSLHNAIRAKFATDIETGKSLYTIYDNQKKSAPTDGSKWCRLTIKRSQSQQVESGPGSFRKHGIVYAQLFCPVEKGDGDLVEMADNIVAAFQGVTAGGVRYLEATVVPIGNDRRGSYQVNVEIRFMAD